MTPHGLARTGSPPGRRRRPPHRPTPGACTSIWISVGSEAATRRRYDERSPAAEHFQRRSVHVRFVPRPATGRSRGLVRTHPCGCSDRTPQPGQRCACSSAVTSASIGLSSSSTPTEATSTPTSPNRRVTSLTKPVAFSRSLLPQQQEDSQSHGHFASIKTQIARSPNQAPRPSSLSPETRLSAFGDLSVRRPDEQHAYS